MELGNSILDNLGIESRVEDIRVFFSDGFYVAFIKALYPEYLFER